MRPLRSVLYAVIFVMGLTALLLPFYLLGVFSSLASGSSRELDSAEAKTMGGQLLAEWPIDSQRPGATTQQTVDAWLKAAKGFTESDGFHGDGADYFQLDLRPGGGDVVRSSLAGAVELQSSSRPPDTTSTGSVRPNWWPGQWPGPVTTYRFQEWNYVIVPATGDRIWLIRVRS
ncbi:MAG: hypothetical protein QM770_02255 [Tepidisphaeraceae bacterium]